MHHIYETNAFVLKNIPQGEADSFVTLFTEELGLVRAVAQGIRYEKSKLRFAVQNYSFAHVSLVRGKGVWRLTNATPIKNFALILKDESLFVVARIFKLLERLLVGESGDEKLFSLIFSGLNYLETVEEKKEKGFLDVEILDIEAVFVLRILNRLGYVGKDEKIGFYTLNENWEGDVIEKMKKERREALLAINAGLRESQL